MTGDGVAPLVIALPERIDRKLRLGPFPSAHDAVKFVGYAAIGALVAAISTPLLWLPFLGFGLLVSIPRFEGRAFDTRLRDYVRWRLRRRAVEGPAKNSKDSGRAEARVPGTTIRLGPDRHAIIVEAHGVPAAFLPSTDRRRLFERYRALLRALDGSFFVSVGVEALDPRPFLPKKAFPRRDPTDGPRAGYTEMVRLLCRRRFRRRIRWLLWTPDGTPAGFAEVEGRTQTLQNHLTQLELDHRRLEGPALAHALRCFGWEPPERER
jgi:hypothetical protein